MVKSEEINMLLYKNNIVRFIANCMPNSWKLEVKTVFIRLKMAYSSDKSVGFD